MEINRGDVFYVNRSETIGSEQRSGRPAIIVSNPECNEHSPVVEVVYLTCQYKKPMPTHVRIESIGRRSTALCEQITSVDVSRLGDYKGHLTDGEMEQVDMALMKSLSIHPLTQQAKVEPVGPSVDDAALAMIALRFLEGFLQKRCGVEISGSIDEFTDTVWGALNEDNKVSLFVRYIDIETGVYETRIVNKNI